MVDAARLQELNDKVRARALGRHLSLAEYCAVQVRWYRQLGQHQERVATDSAGIEYVIGDRDWNRHHPDKRELVDDRLAELRY
jgi:hypothetical protein